MKRFHKVLKVVVFPKAIPSTRSVTLCVRNTSFVGASPIQTSAQVRGGRKADSWQRRVGSSAWARLSACAARRPFARRLNWRSCTCAGPGWRSYRVGADRDGGVGTAGFAGGVGGASAQGAAQQAAAPGPHPQSGRHRCCCTAPASPGLDWYYPANKACESDLPPKWEGCRELLESASDEHDERYLFTLRERARAARCQWTRLSEARCKQRP